MRKVAGLILALGFGALLSGCATNSIVGSGTTRVGTYHGDVGITGNDNVVTINDESRVRRLSIIGNNNQITVDYGAACAKIEIFGSGNTISVPFYLNTAGVRESVIGGNTIIRREAPERPVNTRTTTTYETISISPAGETTTSSTSNTYESPSMTTTYVNP